MVLSALNHCRLALLAVLEQAQAMGVDVVGVDRRGRGNLPRRS
jgi:hypothetical protein